MRLIKAFSGQEWVITPDEPASPAPYAILSHTWGADDDEITFQELQKGSDIYKLGLIKLQFCADQARKDGLGYFWVDTCCIDKTNLVELSEAITSMFRWYRQAAKCYVYLSDVSTDSDDPSNVQEEWESAFRNGRWFQRGWTLQELLAPPTVEFFSREQKRLGTKRTLESLIHEITQIPVDALRGQPLSDFTVDERLKWTKGRQTKKVEDRAYCLLGVFGISMSLRYGEGEEALARLERKVKGTSKIVGSPELVNWLAPSRPREFHARASQSRHHQTGLYFTEGSLIQWLEVASDHGACFSILGKSGTGKTTLFSHIVDAVENFASERRTMAFAYHYCAFSDPQSQQLINILGSFIVQISAWQPSILDDIKPVFDLDQKREQVKTLQVSELEQALVKHGSRLSSVILLVDALNESEDFVETCACIGRLLQQLPGLKVLITSTRQALTSSIGQAVRQDRFQIDPLQDIQTFIESNLDNHITLRCLSTESKNTIRTTLISKADQSFRWVSLVLSNLGQERTERAVLRALTQAPANLYDTYSKMLNAIPIRDRKIAKEALLWVCFAQRPMSLTELSEAVIIDDCDGTLDPHARLVRPEIVLEICLGFLEYDESPKTVKLAHASVRDYLLLHHNKNDGDDFSGFAVEQGHRLLMKRCLTYLMFDNFKTGANRDFATLFYRLGEFPLLGYAVPFWGVHASHATENEWILAREFLSTKFSPNGGNYGTWGSWIMPDWDLMTVVDTEPLYYAASLGMNSLVRALLSETLNLGSGPVQIDAPGGRYGSTPLQVACWRACKRAAKLLVAAGADFWTEDPGTGRPAWFWAKANGWGDVIDDMMQKQPQLARSMRVPQSELRWARSYQTANQLLYVRRQSAGLTDDS